MSAAANTRIATLAADRAVHRAFHWLHLNELRLRQWQLQMLAIPAPPFAEQDRAEWFLDRFRELGLHDPHIDEAGNAVALLPGEVPGEHLPCILLSAHLDTVFPVGTNCTPSEAGPRILGPGACDNAAGLTALLALAASLRVAHIALPCPILFAANVGEEGEGNLRGMRYLLTASLFAKRIAAVIALEGSGNATVVDRALGSRRFRITLTGPGGHSWADAAQPNPIFILAEALTALARLQLPANPRTTLQVGTIAGGTSVNSIPAAATADIDIRSTSPEVLLITEADALLTIRSSVSDAHDRYAAMKLDFPLSLDIALIGDRPAACLDPASPLFLSLRAVDRHLNIATESRIGSTDANLPLSLGIPALAIGAGGTAGGIHTLQEWYDPTGRELALRRLLLHLLDSCTLAKSHSLEVLPEPPLSPTGNL